MNTYKTIFVTAEIVKSMVRYEPNGDQLARDVQATLVEMSQKGYELVSSSTINSNYQTTASHTSGVILIFKKL